MQRRRWLPFGLALAASALLSVGFWLLHIPGFFLLMAFPWLTWPRRTPASPVRTCPACGFVSDDTGTLFCPRDGNALSH